MNIALIVDDPTRVSFVVDNLLKDVEKKEDLLGMQVYSGKYKNITTSILFFRSIQDSINLRAEDLFLFQDLDLIINIGYCYYKQSNTKKLFIGDNVLVSETRCNQEYRNLLSFEESLNKKFSDLNKKIEKGILDVAKKKNFSIQSVSCYSLWGMFDSLEGGIGCSCFDQKAFALYEMAKRHNRHAVCLYKVRNPVSIDVSEYLLDKQIDPLDDLIKLSLEFISVKYKK